MEPQQRTHLVNALMEEAQRMMAVLTKAVEGKEAAQRTEANLHMPDEASHALPTSTLAAEHAAWEQVCAALHDIQTRLDQIAQAERQRIERLTPSA